MFTCCTYICGKSSIIGNLNKLFVMTKKAHKTRRQLLAEKKQAATKLVVKANEISNPLEPLNKYHKYTTKEGAVVEVSCDRVTNLPPETVEWICDLMERNMKTLYQASNWGWDKEVKNKELTEDCAWYLIAKCDGKLIGFSHFRFDLDEDIQVLYCYELQLEHLERRKGLGRFMMQTLEAMAAKNQMQKVMLTVLTKNPAATLFFQKLGYKTDISNPPASEEIDYVILSKQNLRE